MHDRLAAVILVASSIVLSSSFLNATEIRGKVVSVDRGEPYSRGAEFVVQSRTENRLSG
jgi:hypothetical protein